MRIYFITFRSVTPAQRGEQFLRKNGFRCSLQRTPGWMQENGCGYALRLGTDQIGRAAALLEREQIPFRKIYAQDELGNTQEVLL